MYTQHNYFLTFRILG